MTWSLNANGSLGDPGIVDALFNDLNGVLSKPEYGAMGSMFTGLGKWETDFHKAAVIAADVTAPPDSPAVPPAGDSPAPVPVVVGTPPGAGTGQGDGVPVTDSSPES